MQESSKITPEYVDKWLKEQASLELKDFNDEWLADFVINVVEKNYLKNIVKASVGILILSKASKLDTVQSILAFGMALGIEISEQHAKESAQTEELNKMMQ